MHVVGQDELLVTLLALSEETVSGDGGAGKSLPQILRLPEQARPALGPLGKQAGIRRFSIAVSPAPLRPIGGGRTDGEQEQNQTETSGHVERVTDCGHRAQIVGQPILAAAGFQPATAGPKKPPKRRLRARLPAPQCARYCLI